MAEENFEEKLKQAIQIIKQSLGEEEAKRIEEKFASSSKGASGFPSELSPKDIAVLRPVLDNPEILRKILSSPKGKEGLKKIIDERL